MSPIPAPPRSSNVLPPQVLSTSQPSTGIVQDWLRLKGGFLKGWTLYYFVLENGDLTYYTSSDYANKPWKQQLNVLHVRASRTIRHCFVITSYGAQQLVIAATCERDFVKWMKALSLYTTANNFPPHFFREESNRESSMTTASSKTLNHQRHTDDRVSDLQSKKYSSCQSMPSIVLDERVSTSIQRDQQSEGVCQKKSRVLNSEKPIYLYIPTNGTPLHSNDEELQYARAALDNLRLKNNSSIPHRGDLNDPTLEWRVSKPDYTLSDLTFLNGKTRQHRLGSVEMLIENLMKTWEMETSHKKNLSQWSSVNASQYSVRINSGPIFNAQQAQELGKYNYMLHSCPRHLYDSSRESLDSSYMHFAQAFPNGFAWEVQEVFSRPPRVSFSWRHWGSFQGLPHDKSQLGQKRNENDVIELYGYSIIDLDANMQICSMEIFYKPDLFMAALTGKSSPDRNDRNRSKSQACSETDTCPSSRPSVVSLLGGSSVEWGDHNNDMYKDLCRRPSLTSSVDTMENNQELEACEVSKSGCPFKHSTSGSH